MKTKEQIETAIRHLQDALCGSDGNDQVTAIVKGAIIMQLDILNWVLGNDSRFESMVIKPCNQVDGIN